MHSKKKRLRSNGSNQGQEANHAFQQPGSLKSNATFSAYSVLNLGKYPQGTLLFPGRRNLIPNSVGYVRSQIQAGRSAFVRMGRKEITNPRPWRDYPEEALTATCQVLETPFRHSSLLIGCRNVLNEWGYQLRLDRRWWRRAGDPSVDTSWPVLSVAANGLTMLPLAEAQDLPANILTGVPLVIEGESVDRVFLIANCSDIAHSFEVHPRGLIGPSAVAWRELSEAWHRARARDEVGVEISAALNQLALKHGASPSQNLLHSIIGQTFDERLTVFAITGSLDQIAQDLRRRWAIRNALVLEDGGSVGWLFCPEGETVGKLLVAGPNRREKGTAFLNILTGGFVQPVMHGLIGM